MSERITANNLDEVIRKNLEIHDDIQKKVNDIKAQFNTMQVSSSVQLAFQLLKEYGLIQMPIENRYLSGAIFVRNGKKIPVINTALPRANQYFTAWHEVYHLFYDGVSFDHVIEAETVMEERKADHFASLMLLGNLMSCFSELQNMDFLSKIFQCMAVFQAPHKAVLISLYELAVKSGNNTIVQEVKENFDLQIDNIVDRFRALGLDDSLVRPSYVVNVGSLQAKINNALQLEPEMKYHKDNAAFLQNSLMQIRDLIGDINA